MGVNLWGESPLYENRKVFMIKEYYQKYGSRRQWRKGDRPSEANSRGFKQKPDGKRARHSLSRIDQEIATAYEA